MKTLTYILLVIATGCQGGEFLVPCDITYDGVCIIKSEDVEHTTYSEVILAYEHVKFMYPDVDFSDVNFTISSIKKSKAFGFYIPPGYIQVWDNPDKRQRLKTLVHEFLHHVGQEEGVVDHLNHDHFFFDEHSDDCSLESVLAYVILNEEPACDHEYFEQAPNIVVGETHAN